MVEAITTTSTISGNPASDQVASSAQKFTASSSAWKQETVGAFFTRCNWENLPPTILKSITAEKPIRLGYHLNVGQFFRAIPWDGRPIAGIQADESAREDPLLEGLPETESPEDALPYELPNLADIADESHLDGGEVTLDDFLGSFGDSI